MKLWDIFEPQPNWQQQALKDLKTDELPEKLFTRLAEGIDLDPIYHQAATEILPDWKPETWVNLSKIDCKDPKQANEMALKALNSGASGLIFDNTAQKDINPRVLESIYLDYIESVVLEKSGLIPNAWQSIIKLNSEQNRVQATAWALKEAYLKMENEPQSSILFWVELGDRFFVEMANIRALKILVNGLKAELGFEGKIAILGSTSIEGKTKEEVLVSNSLQAVSAVFGGVDMLWVQPHEESEFGRRIALNVSNLLCDEAYLDKVSDPTAGSYFITQLTASLCEAYWEKFKQF